MTHSSGALAGYWPIEMESDMCPMLTVERESRLPPSLDSPAKTLRAVIVSQHYLPEKSGNATRIANMAQNLVKEEVDVTVVCPHPTFPYGFFPKAWGRRVDHSEGGIRVVNLWTWQPRQEDPGFVERIAYYLVFSLHASLWMLRNGRKFDLIISSAPPSLTGIPGLLAGFLQARPLVYDVRDLWIDASLGLGFIRKEGIFERAGQFLERAILARSDLICATTTSLAEGLRERHRLGRKPILQLPNGVAPNFFNTRRIDKQRQIVFVGNVGHAQNMDPVVLSMKLLRRRYPDLRLLVVGSGDLRPHMLRLARKEGLETAVCFLGLLPQEKAFEVISQSIAGLAPIRASNGLEYMAPIKVYEYMACGVPYVGFGDGEIRKLAERTGSGIITESTPEALAKALTYLIENPEIASRMGKLGRDYVLEHHNWADIGRRLKTALTAMLADGGKSFSAEGDKSRAWSAPVLVPPRGR